MARVLISTRKVCWPLSCILEFDYKILNSIELGGKTTEEIIKELQNEQKIIKNSQSEETQKNSNQDTKNSQNEKSKNLNPKILNSEKSEIVQNPKKFQILKTISEESNQKNMNSNPHQSQRIKIMAVKDDITPEEKIEIFRNKIDKIFDKNISMAEIEGTQTENSENGGNKAKKMSRKKRQEIEEIKNRIDQELMRDFIINLRKNNLRFGYQTDSQTRADFGKFTFVEIILVEGQSTFFLYNKKNNCYIFNI